MIGSRRTAALVAAAILTALTLAIPAQAATRGSHGRAQAGRIVWTQVLDDSFTTARLVSARPDGSGLRVLTHPGAKQFDIDAAVSPDGSRVLFERDLPSGRSVLEMVGANGGGTHVVPVSCANPCAGVEAPSWTPSGRHIVFTRVIGPFDLVNQSAHSAVLYISRPDGSGMRRLSQRGIDGVYEDYNARFDASGRYLIFIRVRNQDIKSAVFRMRPDGSDVRQLTP
jgi:Tol biopolymer transport system component